jgi:hypothetical protein
MNLERHARQDSVTAAVGKAAHAKQRGKNKETDKDKSGNLDSTKSHTDRNSDQAQAAMQTKAERKQQSVNMQEQANIRKRLEALEKASRENTQLGVLNAEGIKNLTATLDKGYKYLTIQQIMSQELAAMTYYQVNPLSITEAQAVPERGMSFQDTVRLAMTRQGLLGSNNPGTQVISGPIATITDGTPTPSPTATDVTVIAAVGRGGSD